MKRTVTVLGGDMRQVRLAGLLIEDGWDVITWGLEQGDGPNQAPLKQALAAELLILPLPAGRSSRSPTPYPRQRGPSSWLWSPQSRPSMPAGAW